MTSMTTFRPRQSEARRLPLRPAVPLIPLLDNPGDVDADADVVVPGEPPNISVESLLAELASHMASDTGLELMDFQQEVSASALDRLIELGAVTADVNEFGVTEYMLQPAGAINFQCQSKRPRNPPHIPPPQPI